MQRTAHTLNTELVVIWRHTLSSATQLALAILCGLLLVSSTLAQEQRPEIPEPATAEASPTPKVPDPNDLTTPAPLATQTVDGNLVFTSPGQFTYLRDIHLSDNFGGLRFHGTNGLTTSPAGAAIQFFGNNATPYHGQLYLDSGAHNEAALIFRTAPSGGTITERMRVRADGTVFIGYANTFPGARLNVAADANNSSVALQASSSSSSGYGVSGTAAGSNGFGVFGNATGSGGVGVRGDSNTGTGVRGVSNTGTGVRGVSTSNFGVLGESSGNVGVYGSSYSGTGVLGESTLGNAGTFYGPVQINGRLTKSSGSFKIDHPLDPTNKYLSHSFVESPDMMNIYNGNVTTNARGRAVVTLPDYFAALNRDYRYQLTVVGRFAQAIVASEVKHNRFTIKTNKPGVKVSWQVTGIRQDAYAKKHPIPVEEDKPAAERGTYLNPEAFNQPAEKGAAHARQPATGQQPRAEMSAETTATKPTPSGHR